MTVTAEELAAEGWPIEEQIAHWENDNRGVQQHKFTDASYLSFHLTQDALQQWWLLRDVQEFCLKLCVIYDIVNFRHGRELALFLWAKWYRPGIPCRFANFFARFVVCHHPDSPKSIPDLLDAHRRICAQVRLRQVTLTAEDYKPSPQKIDDRVDSLHENHENYRLEDIFPAVFMVLDTNPPRGRIHGPFENPEFPEGLPVLLVRTGEFHDLKTGPVDFSSIESVSEEVDGDANVRRIAIGDAVDFVLKLHKRSSAND
ncbi:MAG: hypothetical protein Q9169_004170 [Polycauliona sp. 2 TL-2023]